MSHITLQVNSGVFQEDLEPLREYIAWQGEMNYWMFAEQTPYKMLSFLSKQFPDETKVYDIGTHAGASALALSANPNVNVVTYDIYDIVPTDVQCIRHKPRIDIKVGNCLEEPSISELVQSPFVYFDIEPHNGKDEAEFCRILQERGFEGIVVFSNIYLNDDMKAFWESGVPGELKKVDLTEFAHNVGTGAVVFNPAKYDLVIN